MADRYILRVTAGPGYDTAQHVEVPVNQPQPIHITSDRADVELNVRIKDYKGLPRNSPTISPYFETEPHKYNQDQYSISFRFTPKKEDILGLDLQFGNDFDKPIRDRLPPGFNTAMGIVKWWIDPGLDGDAYADRPYLYGPALSSFNALHIGSAPQDESKGGIWVEEGGDKAVREEHNVPSDNKARMKWALSDANKEKWVWGAGKTYSMDFYNPYLDFSKLALRLPGFHLPIMKYWDGQGLRYVLRNRKTGECLLAVCFTLYLKDDVNEDGSIKDGIGAEESFMLVRPADSESEHEEVDEEMAFKVAEEKLGPRHDKTETSADDVD